MEAVDSPIEYAQKIIDLVADACYPVAESALKIASVLLECRLNVEMSAVFSTAPSAVESESEEMPPAQM